MNGTALEEITERGSDATTHPERRALITTLALVEGDILTYLDRAGSCTLRELTRHLDWPARLVTMAVGSLIRERMVRATEYAFAVVLDRVAQPASALVELVEQRVPHARDG